MSNPVMHWQMISTNPSKSAKFYEETFGWSVSSANAMSYREVNTHSSTGIQGGIWPSSVPQNPSFVQLFIAVDDLEAHIKKAQSQGAKVLVPHQKLPDGDEMAVLIDPVGIPFGLMKGTL